MQLRDKLTSFAKTFLVLGAMSVSAFVSADNMNNGWNCCPQPTCCPQVCCDEAPACNWGYNPPANQKCGGNTCCDGFLNNLSGRADFLWWRPYSEGLQLGTEGVFNVMGNNGANESPVVRDATKIKEPKFKFDPGFRLGLGYYCPSKCWDIALNWTHFHSKAKAFGASTFSSAVKSLAPLGAAKNIDPQNSDLFYDDWTHLVGTYPDEVKSRWSLDMDLIDLEFAQKFYVNHCFILRPHFGLRFARVDQNNHVEAFSNHSPNNADENSYQSFVSTVKSKNDFRGVGPRIGLDMEIGLGCGFFLYGKGAASLLFGEFDRNSRQDIAYLNANIGESFIDGNVDIDYTAGDDSRYSITATDLSFGLRWEHCFECCNTYHPFALSIAWEQTAFYDINKFVFVPYTFYGSENPTPPGVYASYNSAEKVGSLTMQGLTISAVIGF
jgi:hypothetical protein